MLSPSFVGSVVVVVVWLDDGGDGGPILIGSSLPVVAGVLAVFVVALDIKTTVVPVAGWVLKTCSTAMCSGLTVFELKFQIKKYCTGPRRLFLFVRRW